MIAGGQLYLIEKKLGTNDLEIGFKIDDELDILYLTNSLEFPEISFKEHT